MKIQKKKTKFLLGFIDIYGSHIRSESRLKKIFLNLRNIQNNCENCLPRFRYRIFIRFLSRLS